MRLPRLLPFGRPKTQQEGGATAPDGIELAREQAMEAMRARQEAPEPPAGPLPETAVPAAEPGAVDPLQGIQADPLTDPLAATQHTAPSVAEADPLAGVAEAAEAPPEDPADAGLLDIFRDAKEETEEGNLAAELEDVAIGDLMDDLMSISNRLGISPAARKRVEAALALDPETTPPPVPAAAEEPPPAGPAIVTPVEDASGPAVEDLPDPIDLLIGSAQPVPEAEPEEEPGDSLVVTAPAPAAAPAEPGGMNTAADGGSSGRRYALHVLFLGLAVSLAAGLGVSGARAGSLVSETVPTPAVLAYLQRPVVPETVTEPEIVTASATPRPTKAPTPSPKPKPTPSPTAVPTPVPYTFKQPAYFMYTVESGDSLTSIATAFNMCPDHILWNNPDREEEDPLMVGDKMLLPGIRGIVYRVQSGDTVQSIAARYSVRAENILGVQANHLAPGQVPSPGSRLLVPDGIPPSALLRDTEAHEMTHIPSWYGYVWPFYGQVTTFYGEQRPGYTHNAVDIGGLGSYGAPVGAAAAGKIAAAVHNDPALGNFVTVEHNDGSRTVYAHLSEIYVEPGQKVDAAEPLGALGCTGHSTGTHLHFEMFVGGAAVDPLDYLP